MTMTILQRMLSVVLHLLRQTCRMLRGSSSSSSSSSSSGGGIRIGIIIDALMYLLGPILLCLATGLITAMTYTTLTVALPMNMDAIQLNNNASGNNNLRLNNVTTTYIFYTIHYTISAFLLTNVVLNYALCVLTKSGHTNKKSNTNNNANFYNVVWQLADATGYDYPKNVVDARIRRKEYVDRMMERRRAREETLDGMSSRSMSSASASSSSNNTNNNDTRRTNNKNNYRPNWMLQGPTEWGWCAHSNQPKPPRAHFDYVTNALVLNMDHYCPWVFNCVGYFNYRYFVNFLLYIEIGTIYIFSLCWRAFLNMSGEEYQQQIQLNLDMFNNAGDAADVSDLLKGKSEIVHLIPHVPTPHERSAVGFMFMMSVAAGVAVALLFWFHAILILTGQTTIEFNATFGRRRLLAAKGKGLVNPYDLGWKQNFRQVYGTRSIFLTFLPSTRAPEFLPIPMAGEKGTVSLSPSQFPCSSFSFCCKNNNNNNDVPSSDNCHIQEGDGNLNNDNSGGIHNHTSETRPMLVSTSGDEENQIMK